MKTNLHFLLGSSPARSGIDKHTIHVVLLLVFVAKCSTIPFRRISNGQGLWNPSWRHYLCSVRLRGTGERLKITFAFYVSCRRFCFYGLEISVSFANIEIFAIFDYDGHFKRSWRLFETKIRSWRRDAPKAGILGLPFCSRPSKKSLILTLSFLFPLHINSWSLRPAPT